MRSISPSTIGLAALLAAALAACDGTPFTAPSAGPTLTPEATAASLTDVPGSDAERRWTGPYRTKAEPHSFRG